MQINPTKSVSELITTISYVSDIEGGRNIYHAWRTAILAARIAKDKVSQKTLKYIFYASLLHDIGGVGFPFHIVHYLERNDKMGRHVLLSHPFIGAQLVLNIPKMEEAARLILDHHEWLNGQGYPRGKSRKNIPLGAQVIRIADAVDILFFTGNYRTLKEIKKRMSCNIDKEYSQDLFDAAMAILKKGDFLKQILQRRNIPVIFEKTRDAVGLIHIPFRIDAVGKTLEFIAQIIDMRHPYASGHSLRVSRYALAIALAMNLDHDEITRIRWAGLIHDIGKINISRYIMNKPAALTKNEFAEVKEHASLTRRITEMMPSLKDIALVASSHHEYFDGSGYPQGLKGDEVPLAARILVICDAFDAMTSNRPYRNPLTPAAACRQLSRLAGKQFDPRITKIAIPLFKNLSL